MSNINFEMELEPSEFTKEKSDSEKGYSDTGDVYFAFLDVLGFSELFSNKDTRKEWADRYQKIFSKYFEIMYASKTIYSAVELAKNSYFGQTSDSLYFYTSEAHVMCEFIKLYAYFSLFAMENGVFFRGGISKGTLYVQQSYQYFGDCVINAYCLENGISKNPIVIVDTNAYDDLKVHLDNPKYEKLLLHDKYTARRFIDPFFYMGREVDFELDGVICEKIGQKNIYDVITDNMVKYEYNEKTYSKYLFLKKMIDESKEDNSNE